MAKQRKYPIREDEVTEHGITMARQVDGREQKLKQSFQINVGKALVFADGWEIDIRSSNDNVLKSMDVHWHHLNREFTEICQQAAFYHHIKGGKNEDSQKMLRGTFSRLGALLCLQPMTHDMLRDGVIENSDYPLTKISERMHAMRSAASSRAMKPGLRLDRYERMMITLFRAVDKMHTSLARGDRNMGEDGLQATAGEDKDNDWRGSEPKPFAVNPDVPWEDPEYDVDNRRDARVEAALKKLDRSIGKFCDVVDTLWMEAVQEVSRRRPVKEDKARHDEAKELLRDAVSALGVIEDEIGETTVGKYEYKRFLYVTKHEVLPQMQRICSLVCRSKDFGTEIRFALPKNRDL